MGTTADKLNKINDTKLAIKQAIIDKGVTNVTDVFSSYPSKIGEIQGGYDWSKIGYSEQPKNNIDSMAFSEQIYKDWNPATTDITSMFAYKIPLLYFPKLDMSNVTIAKNAFRNSFSLNYIPPMNTSKVTDWSGAFCYCNALSDINTLDFSSATNFFTTFAYTKNLVRINQLTSNRVTNYQLAFYDSLIHRVDGIDMLSCINIANAFDKAPYLNYILIKNFCCKPEIKKISFESCPWGQNSQENPDALQSMKTTLLTNSFDRKKAGYESCQIRISTASRALLSAAEATQIENKGYYFVVI